MKKLLLTTVVFSALLPALAHAELYEGETTPMPANAVYSNAGTSPGVYTELVGKYDVDVASCYNSFGQTSQLLTDKKAWVVDENNEIVYTAACQPVGIGMRNMNHFMLTIPEADKITAPGTYYMIFPIGMSKTKPNQGQLASTGQWEDVYNLKAGPYIVGELGESVDAIVNVYPQGDFDLSSMPKKVEITVGNADIFNVGTLEDIITVTNAKGTELEMEPGEKNGNTLSWEFPYDGAIGDVAPLPSGTYTITVDYSTFSAYTSELNPLLFPAEKQEYKFVVEGGELRVEPVIVTKPAAGKLESWNGSTALIVTFSEWKFVTRPVANQFDLVVISPSNEMKTYPLSSRTSYVQVSFKVSPDDFAENGLYRCYLKCGGQECVNVADPSKTGIFEDAYFEYQIGEVKPDPVDATCVLTPQGVLNEAPEGITLTVENAATLILAAEGKALTVSNDGSEIEMMPGEISGNAIEWRFPDTWTQDAGQYTVTLDYAAISGETSDGAELIFPSEPQVVEFTIEKQIREYTPEFKAIPDTTIRQWDAKIFGVELKDCRFKDLSATRNIYLEITYPDGTSESVKVKRTAAYQLQFSLNADKMKETGKYSIVIKTAGLAGLLSENDEEVVLTNLNLEYDLVYPLVPMATVDGVPATDGGAEIEIPYDDRVVVALQPAEGASPETTLFYVWKPAGEDTSAAEEMEYVSPVKIYEAGTFEYYSKVGESVSESAVITFVEGEDNIVATTLLPDSKVTPEPDATYNGIENITIVFGKESLSGFNGWVSDSFTAVAKVSDNAGNIREYKPVVSEDGMEISYPVNISEDGVYKVSVVLTDMPYNLALAGREAETAESPRARIVLNYTIDIKTGVSVIATESGEAIYYDLNGVRLEKRPSGGIYIRVCNGKADKRIAE